MLGIERRNKIMQKLQAERKVYVSELSQAFQVTEETIRRDLEKLETKNLLRRSYGGAVLSEHTGEDISFVKRATLNSDAKAYIASKAACFVASGDAFMADASTTCLALLKHLQDKPHLTIITNSVRIVHDFWNSPFTIISSGGRLRPHSLALTGDMACDALQRYFVDLAIISCKGLDQEKGVMESNEAESTIKQVMMRQAKKTILLADHTKFDQTAFVKTCGFDKIATLITDENPGHAWMDFLAKQDIEVIF